MTKLTGPQHADAAEQLLGSYNEILAAILKGDADGPTDDQLAGSLHLASTQLQAAQVHATLALTSATAANIRRNGYVPNRASEWVG